MQNGIWKCFRGARTYQQPTSCLRATCRQPAQQLQSCRPNSTTAQKAAGPTVQLPAQQHKNNLRAACSTAQELPAQQHKNNLRAAGSTAQELPAQQLPPTARASARRSQTAPEHGVALPNGSRAPRASSKCPRSNSRAFCKHFRAPKIAGPTASSPQKSTDPQMTDFYPMSRNKACSYHRMGVDNTCHRESAPSFGSGRTHANFRQKGDRCFGPQNIEFHRVPLSCWVWRLASSFQALSEPLGPLLLHQIVH